MMDQRTTYTTSLLYLMLGILSSHLICSAEPQKHGSGIPVLDLSQPPFTHNFVPDIFPPPTVTPDPLEYLESQQDDMTEAIYAGRFAKELYRLENHNNDIFTNFITDGFESNDIPRHLPELLIGISRKSLQTGFFNQPGFDVPASGGDSVHNSFPANVGNSVHNSFPTNVGNSVHNSFLRSRGRSGGGGRGSAVAGVGTPHASPVGPRGVLLPIEKGRLVTKTTTTDFGSIFPLRRSRTGRRLKNIFRFPSEPAHTRSFLTHKSQLFY